MSFMVPLTLFGWIAVVLALFAILPPRRAVIAAFSIAWLFLPMAGYSLPGLPDYTKTTAACYGTLLGAMIFDGARFIAFRLRWIDLPMAVWCLCPFASSISNDLGPYDGVSAVISQAATWGLPYLIGRLYFSNLVALRELAIGILIGGLVYVPLCLYEIRMSPQLHTMVYGFHQHQFAQTKRFGGWRPTVFMQHGLSVGMWMCMASLTGVWLWVSGALGRLRGMPTAWLLPVLLITTVMCKSTGALVLLAVGLAVLCLCKWWKSSVPVWCLVAVAPLYMGLRATGSWSGAGLVSLSAGVSEERAGSLEFRMANENKLAAKALQRPVFGWGAWGRARVFEENSRGEMVDVSVTDGLWIIALGQRGLVGLAALTTWMLLPAVLLCRNWPVTGWSRPVVAGAAALAVITTLYMIDSLFNAMVNPIFMLAAGGLMSLSNEKSFPLRDGGGPLLRVEDRKNRLRTVGPRSSTVCPDANRR